MKAHTLLIAPTLLSGAMLCVTPAWADDLLSLYREAVQADANFLATQADVRARREVGSQALANLLPNLSFGGSVNRNSVDWEQKYSSGSKPSDTTDYKSHDYGVSLRQPVFRPAAYAAYKQAQAQVESIDANLQWAEQEIGTRVGAAYFDVLLAESELDVTKAQRDSYLTQLDYAQKAFQTGAGTRTDIDEARSQLDLAVAQTLELQYRLKYAQDALTAIIDRPLTGLARLSPDRMQLAAPNPPRVEDWIRQAEEVNPQLVALRASVESADRNVDRMLSAHLPTLDLMARHSKSQSKGASTLYDSTNKETSTMYGVQFDMPLFSGGATQSTVRQARAEWDKAKQQLEATRRDIGLQVRKEFDGVVQGVSWVRAYDQAVKSAEQALQSTKKGFQAGTRSTLDILTANQNLATARRDLNRGRYQYVLSQLKLLSLVGRLNEQEIGRFNGWLEARE